MSRPLADLGTALQAVRRRPLAWEGLRAEWIAKA